MKYIMIEVRPDLKDCIINIPVIFPDMLVHKLIADQIKAMMVMEHGWSNIKTVSAGFIRMSDLKCYGKSETLNLDSRPEEDTAIIQTYDLMKGL